MAASPTLDLPDGETQRERLSKTGQRPLLKVTRVTGDDCVIGKSSVAMRVIQNVGRADFPIPLHGPRRTDVQGVVVIRVCEPGFDGNHIAWTPESVTGAKGIAHRNALHAASHTQSKIANFRHAM
jgi:hypothetical protein